MSIPTDWCLAQMHTVGAILASRLARMDSVVAAQYADGVMTVQFREAATPLVLDVGAVVSPVCVGATDRDRVDTARKLYLAYLLPRLEDVAESANKERAVRHLQADFKRKTRVALRQR